MSPARSLLYCSFCRRDEDHVAKLVAGPGVYICDECIGLCTRALRGKPSKFPGWEALTDDQVLATLPAAAAAVGSADAKLREHVALLRKRGVSWERIGESLGTTRQSAWERFRGAD